MSDGNRYWRHSYVQRPGDDQEHSSDAAIVHPLGKPDTGYRRRRERPLVDLEQRNLGNLGRIRNCRRKWIDYRYPER
jgi:hypothetical protein